MPPPQAAPGASTSAGTERPASWDDVIAVIAKAEGVSPLLAQAVATKESGAGRNPNAVGDQGKAFGMFQLHRGAATDTGVNRFDHLENVRGGVRYLKQLSDRYGGDVQKTLMAYNGGMAGVDSGTSTPAAQAYAADVLAGLSQRVRQTAGGPAVQAAPPSTPGGVQALPVAAPAAAQPPVAPGSLAPPPGAGAGGYTLDPSGNAEWSAMNIARGFGEAFDPRSSEGRQNLAATGAEIGVNFIPGLKPIKLTVQAVKAGQTLARGVRAANIARRVVAPAVAAGIGGGGEAAIEQAISPPPSTAITLPPGTGLGDLVASEPPDSPTRVAVTQALYSVGGQVALLPLRGAAKVFLASSVGKTATAGVEEAVTIARDTGKAARAAIRDKVNEGLAAARIVMNAADKTRAAVVNRTITPAAGESAIRATAARIPGAAAAQAQQELDNVAALGAATRELDNLLPPSIEATVAAQRRVLAGPAKVALDQAGARVDEAARSGPMISLRGVHAAIRAMIDRETPAFEREAAEAAARASSTGAAPAVAAGVGTGERISREEYQRLITEHLNAPADSPLPKTLAKIMSAPEQIAFHDAHLLKRDLDEHVRWDAVAKKRMEQWTKGARIAIREEMAGHAPYDIATAAYEGLIPLYRRGVGKKLATALTNNPDEAARLLVERSPIRAQMLKDLLVTQSAAGGDPAAGKLAWDLVRSAYTYDHLIKGNPLKLGDRVTTLLRDHPEFVKVIADDPAGQGVLDNLVRIGTAITDAEARAVEQSATTRVAQKVAGHTLIRETAERTQATTRAAEATRTRLAGTSLRSVETAAGEAAAGIALGPKSWFGARYILRTLKGTKADDLLEWAAYSSQNTQRFTQALLGPIPDRAFSILLRDMLGGSSPLPPPTIVGTPSAVARNQPQP